MDIVNQVNLNMTAWSVVKIAVIIGLVIYLIFAFIVMKQVNLMTETLEIDFEKPIKVVAIAHFIYALFVLIFALFV
jgi:hypothetical protein